MAILSFLSQLRSTPDDDGGTSDPTPQDVALPGVTFFSSAAAIVTLSIVGCLVLDNLEFTKHHKRLHKQRLAADDCFSSNGGEGDLETPLLADGAAAFNRVAAGELDDQPPPLQHQEVLAPALASDQAPEYSSTAAQHAGNSSPSARSSSSGAAGSRRLAAIAAAVQAQAGSSMLEWDAPLRTPGALSHRSGLQAAGGGLERTWPDRQQPWGANQPNAAAPGLAAALSKANFPAGLATLGSTARRMSSSSAAAAAAEGGAGAASAATQQRGGGHPASTSSAAASLHATPAKPNSHREPPAGAGALGNAAAAGGASAASTPGRSKARSDAAGQGASVTSTSNRAKASQGLRDIATLLQPPAASTNGLIGGGLKRSVSVSSNASWATIDSIPTQSVRPTASFHSSHPSSVANAQNPRRLLFGAVDEALQPQAVAGGLHNLNSGGSEVGAVGTAPRLDAVALAQLNGGGSEVGVVGTAPRMDAAALAQLAEPPGASSIEPVTNPGPKTQAAPRLAAPRLVRHHAAVAEAAPWGANASHQPLSILHPFTQYCAFIFFNFVITLSVFPGVTAFICSASNPATVSPCAANPPSGRLSGDLFVPFMYVLFNLGDFLGRAASGLGPWRRQAPSGAQLTVYCLLRCGCAAALLLCHVVTPSTWQLRPLFGADWQSWTLASALGFTNGHLMSVACMHAPAFLPASSQRIYGAVVSLCCTGGCFFGALVSLVVLDLFQA